MWKVSPPAATFLIAADWDRNLQLIGATVLLAAAIGLGVAAIVWVKRWREQLTEEPTAGEQLETFQIMHDEGLIDSEEYERILERMRLEADPPEPPASTSPPSEPTP